MMKPVKVRRVLLKLIVSLPISLGAIGGVAAALEDAPQMTEAAQEVIARAAAPITHYRQWTGPTKEVTNSDLGMAVTTSRDVPDLGTMLLLGSGLFGIGVLRMRRQLPRETGDEDGEVSKGGVLRI